MITTTRRNVVPIVALDFPNARSALELVSRLGDSCRFYKVGSELFTASGPSVVKALRREGYDVFLDLKLHDIPNTVAGAIRRIRAMGVSLATVHASGGRAMLEAAVIAAGGECGILAVTVLTSISGTELVEILGPGNETVEGVVMRLADLASETGARGIVCSGHEARKVRERFGTSLELLVPGIRLPGDAADDQSRIVTPEAAAAAGADYVVLGRVVTAAGDPAQVMTQIRSRLVA